MRLRSAFHIFVCLSLPLAVVAFDELTFDLPSGAKESLWRDALAEKLGGQTEVRVPEGRVDVLTDEEAIEVDFQHKWKEGLGQCLVYARATNRRPVLALITYGENAEETTRHTEALFAVAEEHCASNGVRLLVLRPSRNDEFVRADPTKKGKPVVKHCLSPSGVRHNSGCRYYSPDAKPCGPDEGRPCGVCGG